MFLHVTFLSEIATSDGIMLEGWAWHGFKTPIRINHYIWPRCPNRLSPNHWKLWQRALRVTFTTQLGESERTLRVSMGNWIACTRDLWKWFYSAADDRIYQHQPLGWTVYSKIPSQTQRLKSRKFVKIADQGIIVAHDDLQMITVYKSHEHIQISGIGMFEEVEPINNCSTNVLQLLDRLPDN
jgi:hypothetical protein